MLLSAAISLAQCPFEDAVLYLCGASDISEVDQSQFDRFERFADHPLSLNCAPRSRLLSCGLFSSYQVESMLDYRSRNGDILSSRELGMVDGFEPRMAECLALFLDFSQSSSEDRRIFAESSAGAALKIAQGALSTRYQVRADVSWKGFDAAVSTRSDWTAAPVAPSSLVWHLSYHGSRHVDNVTLGWYNIRIGQGLNVWSGVRFNSISNPSSLVLKPSGVVEYYSYSMDYAFFGTAASAHWKMFDIALWADAAALLPTTGVKRAPSAGANLLWRHRHGEAGVCTSWSLGRSRPDVSLDMRQTVRGVVIFGELCAAGLKEIKALAGVKADLGPVESAARLSYDAGELNLSDAFQWLWNHQRNRLGLSSSLSYYPIARGQIPERSMQFKAMVECQLQPWSRWTFNSRINMRRRLLTRGADMDAPHAKDWPALRIELRQDVTYRASRWSSSLRLDGVVGHAPAGLVYSENALLLTGDSRYSLKAYLQAGVFKVDDWDDRIYVYRRDAPGGAMSSAMYGRGWYTAFYSAADYKLHIASRVLDFKLYLRVDYTSYPWARPGDTHRCPSLGSSLTLCLKFL